MKYIKFLLVMMAVFATIGTGFCQRNLILTHGFGDNNTSWNVYRPFLANIANTASNNAIVRRAGYDSNLGVASGATEVDGNINLTGGTQNIAIGQSMGGIVLREIDRDRVTFPTQNFGGIITLGSPNRGGVLLNALRAGTVQAQLHDGCSHVGGAISTAVLASATISPGFLAGFGVALGGAIYGIKNTFCNDANDLINQRLPANDAPLTARDLSEGSNVITGLTTSNTPTFKVGVFGIEESPVHMRVLSSLKNDPFNQPLANSLSEANTDQEFVDLFNLARDIVTVGEAVFIMAAITLSICAIWNWPLLYPAVICAWAAYEWSALRRWLNQSESKWHAVIGAGGFFQETVNFRTFTCNSQLDDAYDLYDTRRITLGQLRLIEQRLNADPNCFANLPQTVWFPINNQSDGLFNAGTQRIPTDPNNPSHVVNLPVEGVNHREFFNHPAMSQAFTAIFAGQRGVNQFFLIQ
jgi:hypothetical protein